MYKFISEFSPIIIFFISYKYLGLNSATMILIATTIITLIINYLTKQKSSIIAIISSLMLVILGGISIYTGDSKFIKLKPTIVNLTFSLILFSGIIKKQGLIKYLLQNTISLSDQAWLKLSLRWAIFFLILALANELVWRNYSEENWIKFKVFGITAVTILFTIMQIPFIHKYSLEKNK